MSLMRKNKAEINAAAKVASSAHYRSAKTWPRSGSIQIAY
jgi:hypothetical protein